MDAKEKEDFIEGLTRSVAQSLKGKVCNMPDEWDGHELRQRLADLFAHEVISGTMKGRRLRDYRNEVATRDI